MSAGSRPAPDEARAARGLPLAGSTPSPADAGGPAPDGVAAARPPGHPGVEPPSRRGRSRDAARDLAAGAQVHLRGVAFVAGGFDAPGGMEGQARGLAEALARRGLPVTFLTTAPPGAGLPRRELRGLVEVFRFPVPAAVDWRTSLAAFELFAWGVLAGRRERVELVYGVHHETGALAVQLARALGRPSVVKLACAGEQGDAFAVCRHPERRRLLRALRRATRVVAISSQVAAEAEAVLGLDPARLLRLPNGVDRRRFRPPLAPPRARPPRLLFLGRLDEQKRPDLLLEAFAGLVGAPDAADALPPELELHFAGEGPWRARLEASARALGLEGRVRFLGLCADAPGLLRSGPLALALPSVAEGMPNAVLEALACGVPVVASDLPGTREAAGDAALLVPPGDLPALRAALARVLADDGLRARLAAAGPERARSFDLDALAARHLALFHELAGSAPRIAPPLRPSALLPPAGAGLRVLGGAARSLRAALGGRLTRSFGGGDTRDEPARAAPPSPDPKEDP